MTQHAGNREGGAKGAGLGVQTSGGQGTVLNRHLHSSEWRLPRRLCVGYARSMEAPHPTHALADMTPREYHARREAEQLAAREALRERRLEAAREAIARLAPQFPRIAAAHLFGSVLQLGRHTRRSDVDVAVDCDDLEEESRFWMALEEALDTQVDVRPRRGAIADAVTSSGEKVYEREATGSRSGSA